jgi:hypothetical protein
MFRCLDIAPVYGALRAAALGLLLGGAICIMLLLAGCVGLSSGPRVVINPCHPWMTGCPAGNTGPIAPPGVTAIHAHASRHSIYIGVTKGW